MPGPAYLNPSLPLAERVADLLSRMTAEEKAGFLPTRQHAVPRLGIPAYAVGGEGAHGLVVRTHGSQWPNGEATVFPQPIGLSSTWDTDLMRRVGDVIGTEARVYYHRDGRSRWLTLWFPTIDMERDPRWGRTEEAYGEDPFLAGKLAAALIRGAQGDDPFYVKTTCAPKHFYGNNVEKNRASVSTDLSERVKREYYLRVFQYAFTEGKALSLMTAYNEINGVPCIVNPEALDIVKGEWGCEGFIVCDGGDFSQTVTHHHYCETHTESIALSLKAGVDCFPDSAELIVQSALDALKKGLIDEADIDRALTNIFKVRFRMGQFDPDSLCPYTAIPPERLCCQEHTDVALEAAQKSVVLLQNDGILPLDPNACGKVLVVGDLADVTMPDWYSGKPPQAVTPLQAIRDALPEGTVETADTHDVCVIFHEGTGGWLRVDEAGDVFFDGDMDTRSVFEEHDYGFTSAAYRDIKTGKFLNIRYDGSLGCTADALWGWFTYELFFREENTGRFLPHGETFRDGLSDEGKEKANSVMRSLRRELLTDGLSRAVDAAARCDTVIAVLGNHPLVNGRECFDRPDITFPRRWTSLLERMRAVNPNIILTLIAGYPYAFPKEAKSVRAALYTSHGEQHVGTAVAGALFGQLNPAGRLSMTWYLSQDDLPDINDYDIINSPRTYMYFDKPVQYPFGYGLSYTSFEYTGLSVQAADGVLEVSCSVRNTGGRAGDEVVQLYVTLHGSPVKAPIRRLCGFERVPLQPGEVKAVSFLMPPDELTLYGEAKPDKATFAIGASSADIKLTEVVPL
ncbi:MAG: glycoside hydrolase family 3 C-terminal domain-containing protein [Oscillospiraceae bacterium]|jgi:beta-glucosidase|nr:glycoside hydrolase family 3 C-terminal domain-containing protein [Oscillospiraceae bacterium]